MKNRFIKLKDEFLELSVFDKIFDILVFLGMVTVTILQAVRYDNGFTTLQLGLNLTASLTLFLGRIILSPKTILGRLPLRNQKYIDIVVLFGSIGGQYLFLYDYYHNFDTFTHLLTGCVVCLIAYDIYEVYSGEPGWKKPLLCSTYCFFMSMTAALLWELFEFTSDFFFGGECQGYKASLETPKFFYFRWFTFAKRPEQQYALYDTFADITAAVITAVITVIIMNAVLKKKSEKMMSAAEIPDDCEI